MNDTNDTRQQSYGLACLVSFLVCGMVFAYFFRNLVDYAFCAIASVCSLVMLPLIWRRHIVFAVTVCFISFLLGGVFMKHALNPQEKVVAGKTVCCRALVISTPQQRGKTLRFDALVMAVDDVKLSPFKTRMTVWQDEKVSSIARGACIGCVAAFEKVETKGQSRQRNAYSYQRFLLSQGINTQAFVRSSTISKEQIEDCDIPLVGRLHLVAASLRRRVAQQYKLLGLDGDDLAVVVAMTLGEKQMLNAQLKDDYSVAGASHVLALSGLHLGIIYALLTMLLWRRNRLVTWRIGVSLVILFFIWNYVMLVGMPVSAVRSAVMLTVFGVCRVMLRQVGSLAALSFAALVVVMHNPLALFDVGFLMSFASVASIVVAATPLYEWITPRRMKQCAPSRWLCQLAAVSVSAQIGVAPIAMCCFQRFSCYFLLTNVVAVPLATLLLYLSVAIVMLVPLPAVQTSLMPLLQWAASALNHSLHLIASLPNASVEGIRLSAVQALLLYALLIAVGWGVKIVAQRKLYGVNYCRYPDV